MKALVALLIVLGLTGCISAAPGSETVLLTRSAADVEGCRIIGPVHIQPQPFTLGSKDMKTHAYALGGDTVYVTSNPALGFNVVTDGVIYNCKGIDRRQPRPVTIVKETP